MATKYDLKLYRGDTVEWGVRVFAADGITPIDLTGSTVAAQFRDKFDGTQVVDFDTTIELPNIIHVEVTPAMWTDASTGGVWDLQVTDDVGAITTVAAGKVTVTLDVTAP